MQRQHAHGINVANDTLCICLAFAQPNEKREIWVMSLISSMFFWLFVDTHLAAGIVTNKYAEPPPNRVHTKTMTFI